MKTRVINVRDYRPGQPWPEGFVYCGRAVLPRFPQDSPFCNPFPVSQHGLSAGPAFVIAMRANKPQAISLRERIVRELPGKVLGCWCVEPRWRPGHSHRCHAEVLAALADGDHATVDAACELFWWTTPPAHLAAPVQGRLL